MATAAQKKAAKTNVKKAQAAWKSMSSGEHARAQPEGRARSEPSSGGGEFYRVEVRDKSDFKTFRTQDVGEKGGIERLAGKRSSGSWDTVSWLISKEHAHKRGDTLVADSDDAQHVLDEIGSKPKHVGGDRFTAKPRPNVPEKDKPTPAQKRARSANIKKAQAAAHGG